jgi:hypothetical protein
MGANSSGPGVYAVSAPPVAPVARGTIKKNEPRLICSTNKTDRYDKSTILLKVALDTTTITPVEVAIMISFINNYCKQGSY